MCNFKLAMEWMAAQPTTLFLGQSVAYPGVKMSGSLHDIPTERRIEMPVAEELQLGLSLGLSLCGFVPISIFPRWNFLLCAANQLVNHLDRLPDYSGFKPKVIIRTAVGQSRPLDAGPQHTGDFSDAFRSIFKTIKVVTVESDNVLTAYQQAFYRPESTILVE